MDVIKKIDVLLDVVKQALAWQAKYGKNSFPVAHVKELRRHLKRIHFALEEKCSAAAYGESQNGKSYLISSLLSTADEELTILSGGHKYSFINDINPSGGNTSKKESTGIITRFTIKPDEAAKDGKVRIRLLTVSDIVTMLTDSFYLDVKADAGNLIQTDEINLKLDDILPAIVGKDYVQDFVSEDDIYIIQEYLNTVIGSTTSNIYGSRFCRKVSAAIAHIHPEHWADVFSLLWNNNQEITGLFKKLVDEYAKLHFQSEIYAPFDLVLREKGTILDITWLDYLFGKNTAAAMNENYSEYIDVYSKDGQMLTEHFSKASLSALIAELVLQLPESAAKERPFLHQFDLLDFPGARHRMKLPEDSIPTELAMMTRRGKVAYLFNKYSQALRINSVLFCQNQDKPESELGEILDNWIRTNIGATAEKRSEYIATTNYTSPFMIVSTFFNCDLQWTNETKERNEKVPLSDRWKTRFENHLCNEVIRPNIYSWFDQWVVPSKGFSSEAFQSIYLLRDYFWSARQGVFQGYKAGVSPEKEVQHPADYPDYMDDLKQSFVTFPFVKKHFAHPEKSWEAAASLNHDGSMAVIDALNNVSLVIESARLQKYDKEASEIRAELLDVLKQYYVSSDIAEKQAEAQRVAGEISFSLDLMTPAAFGSMINEFMVQPDEIRNIVSDILRHKKETPVDFTMVNVIRLNAGITATGTRDENLQKLLNLYHTDERTIKQGLKMQNIDLEDVISGQSEVLTTEADVLAKNITDYWVSFIGEAANKVGQRLRHSDRIAGMFEVKYRQQNIRQQIVDKITLYEKTYSDLGVQINIITDSVCLLLNDFICNVGKTDDRPKKKMPMKEVLGAFDKSADLLRFQSFDEKSRNTLSKLPLWANFKRWETDVVEGITATGKDIAFDEEENAEVGKLIEQLNEN